MVGTCHCSCRLQAAGVLLFPWLSSGKYINIIKLSYHTPLPAYACPIWHFIWISIQVRLGHNSPNQNTTYCSVAQSKEIKVFICNFLSHLSVNVSSYKHFMAIFVQRLLLIISAFNSIKRKVYRFHGDIWHLFQSIDIRAEHNLHSASASKDPSFFITDLVHKC